MKHKDLKTFLDEKAEQYNTPQFVSEDPISIPHAFSKKEDVEISAFLASIIAWGQRKTIIKNAWRIMDLMDRAPYDFILNHEPSDLNSAEGFVHRTFNSTDLVYFFSSLQNIYQNHGGLEKVLCPSNEENGTALSISKFKHTFFELVHEKRTEKHIADPLKGSSAKRLNMYLRWMVRKDKKGVDFGIWDSFPMSKLSIPLDIHTGNVGRKLGLLKRKQNDSKAVDEFDISLRALNPIDPVKYDFALFGLGAYEDF